MRVLRRQKSGYALSLTFCIIGLVLLLITLWITWTQVAVSENPLSTFWTLLWIEQLNLVPGLEVKLAYLFISALIMLPAGIATLILSRQWLPLATENAVFQCPFCRKKWRRSPDKGIVQCPHCQQLVRPKMAEK